MRLATVPLAFLTGKTGRVVAVDKERWHYFHEVVSDSGLRPLIDAIGCDARQLPMHSKCFDLAMIVHGIRSLKDEDTIISVLSEMMRVSYRIFLAESLPVARTKAQAAHLEMYNLREEIFEAVLGSKDDIHYPDFDTLKKLVEEAGGRITKSGILEVNLPHYLAFIPREYVEKIQDPVKKANLLSRWDLANKQIMKHGEEHPPVALLSAEAKLG